MSDATIRLLADTAQFEKAMASAEATLGRISSVAGAFGVTLGGAALSSFVADNHHHRRRRLSRLTAHRLAGVSSRGERWSARAPTTPRKEPSMNQAAKAEEFDLSRYEAHDVGILEVKTPQGEPLLGAGGQPVKIHLYGPGSAEHIKAQAKFERAVQAAAFAAMRNKPGSEQEADGVKLEADKLAAITAKIEHFPIEPAALYGNPKLRYITEQAMRFSGAWSNFLPQFTKG